MMNAGELRGAQASLVREGVQPGHDGAARATRAGMMGEGLIRLLVPVLEPKTGSPPAAPGFDELVATLRTGRVVARRAADSGAARSQLALEALQQTTDDDLLKAIPGCQSAARAVNAAAGLAIAKAEQAERALRDLAQLALGIAQAAAETPDVSDVERGAIAILHPPLGDDRGVALGSDQPLLRYSNSAELVTEVSGLIAHLLIDRWTVLVLSARDHPDYYVALTVDSTDTLLAETVAGYATKQSKRLLALGWKAAEIGYFRREWPSPVTILKVARMVSSTVIDVLGMPTASTITARTGRTPDMPRPQVTPAGP
jgi:hypothetical protein